MAHLRNTRRKRKLAIDDIINLSDNELVESSSEDSDVEIIEKNAKIRHVDLTVSQDSNLEISSQSCTVEDNADVDIVEVSSEKEGLARVPSVEDLFSSQEVEFVGPKLPNGSLQADRNVEVIRPCRNMGYSNILQPLGSLNSYQSDTLTSSLDTKTSCLIQSQDSESNTGFCILNSEIHGDRIEHINIKQKLLELEEEIQQLKAENEGLRFTSSACNKQCAVDDIQTAQDLIATITFNKVEDYNIYKNDFLTAFQPALKFDIKERESDLVIEIFKDDVDISDWVVIDDVEAIPKEKSKKNKHKKKKKKREKADDNLFVLDTTPFIQTKSSLQYQSKFSVTLNKPNEQGEQKVNIANCFNCNESHNLRDCPRPRNFSKINAARQKFKGSQNKSVRYHLEDDQRFGHLKPGIISEKLRHALGLRDDQLPVHIYKMRQIGYPPGWFEELQTAPCSDLLLFDFEGKNDLKAKTESGFIDPDKIVEYSGFNIPIEKGVRDEFRQYGCVPYSKENSKRKMLEYVRKLSQTANDNLESCDMDIEDPTSPKANQDSSPCTPVRCSSPTLNELENVKVKLLSELVDANDDSISNSISVQDENNDSREEGLKTIDVTGTPDDLNTTPVQSHSNSPLPNVNSVKITTFGTPILSSLSPYSKLPRPENFQQNVSDVINFENLPDSTGKYEQMVGVLDKVRKQMKRLNSL